MSRAAVGRPRRDERRIAGAVFPGRRKFHFLRRETPDNRQSGYGARSESVPALENRRRTGGGSAGGAYAGCRFACGEPRGRGVSAPEQPAPPGPAAHALDTAQVRRAFERAAATYDSAAVLHAEVRDNLLQRLDWMTVAPRLVLDA